MAKAGKPTTIVSAVGTAAGAGAAAAKGEAIGAAEGTAAGAGAVDGCGISRGGRTLLAVHRALLKEFPAGESDTMSAESVLQTLNAKGYHFSRDTVRRALGRRPVR